jgi:hypothetical protein
MNLASCCKRTIIVLSADYLSADYTHPEWESAFVRDPRATDRSLVPVRVRVCEVPPLLARIIRIDLVDRNEDEARLALVEGVQEGRLKRTITFPGLGQAALTTFPGPQQLSVVLPEAGERAVLVKSRRRCCVCYVLDRKDNVCDGKIVQLDYDLQNTREDNLVWLCLRHYEEYRGAVEAPAPKSQSLSEGEIKAYRQSLYDHIEELDRTNRNTVFELNIKIDSTLRTRDAQEANAEAIAAIVRKLETEFQGPIRSVCIYLGSITLVLESSRRMFSRCFAAFQAGQLTAFVGIEVSAITFSCGWRPRRPRAVGGTADLILLNLNARSEVPYQFSRYKSRRRHWWKYAVFAATLLLTAAMVYELEFATIKHWAGVALSLREAPEPLGPINLPAPDISITQPPSGFKFIVGEQFTISGKLNRKCRGCSGLAFVYVETEQGLVQAEVNGENWSVGYLLFPNVGDDNTIWVGRFVAPISGKTIRPFAVASEEVRVKVLPRKK